ncbi:hypothetical protein GCM10025879_21500 [Leuconostoc litchii]|nr:hypothetical protein GCM10025879_21500 [Leuconostoc litchii]
MKYEKQVEQVLLSTGNVNKPYVIRDLVFVTKRISADIFAPDFDLNKALTGWLSAKRKSFCLWRNRRYQLSL